MEVMKSRNKSIVSRLKLEDLEKGNGIFIHQKLMKTKCVNISTTRVPSGFSGYVWLDKKIVLTKMR